MDEGDTQKASKKTVKKLRGLTKEELIKYALRQRSSAKHFLEEAQTRQSEVSRLESLVVELQRCLLDERRGRRTVLMALLSSYATVASELAPLVQQMKLGPIPGDPRR